MRVSVLDQLGLRDEVFRLWHLGYSSKRISDELGGVITERSIYRYLAKNGYNPSLPYRWIKCEHCGKKFKKQRANIRKSRRHFCSKSCYYAYSGNPDYFRSVWHMRQAREVVRATGFLLAPEHVVHHEDSNTENNMLENLIVFANQGDHTRWHRGDRNLVKPLWTGTGG